MYTHITYTTHTHYVCTLCMYTHIMYTHIDAGRATTWRVLESLPLNRCQWYPGAGGAAFGGRRSHIHTHTDT